MSAWEEAQISGKSVIHVDMVTRLKNERHARRGRTADATSECEGQASALRPDTHTQKQALP